MYEAFYGFCEKPFSLVPDPEFLYLSDKHRLALALLEYGLINQAGFTVITGNIGTGKTTLVRHLLQGLDDEFRVGLITNTHPEFGELLHWILMAFDLDYKGKNKVESYHAFVDFLIGEYAKNKRTVLIVDEAQNLSPEILEELRMLSNVNADKHQVLQTILVGQQELRDTLRRPDLVQFAQRITADYHLKPLDQKETRAYIEHRLGVVGGASKLFEPAACDVIFKHSGGIPRLINLLCDTALVYGYAEQRRQITAALAEEVVKEKQAGGIFPQIDATDDGAEQHEVFTPSDATELPEAHTLLDDPHDRHEPPALMEEEVRPTLASSAPHTPDSFEPDKTVKPKAAPATLEKHVTVANGLRISIIANRRSHGEHLAHVLALRGLKVLGHLPFGDKLATQLEANETDVVLVDLDEHIEDDYDYLEELLEKWGLPTLFNDSLTTGIDIKKQDPLFSKKLASKITSLAEISKQEVTRISSPHPP